MPKYEDASERKIFHHEPYYTPNNFDIYFNPDDIPSNIQMENGYNLERRLQKLMPLTKIIHLNLDSGTVPGDNNIRIHGEMLVNNKKVVFI